MNYIYNTTFVIDRGVTDEFLHWVKAEYLAAVHRSETFSSVLMTRILLEVDPMTTNFCVQTTSSSLEEATRWHETIGANLIGALTNRLGDRVLTFSTPMEVVNA